MTAEEHSKWLPPKETIALLKSRMPYLIAVSTLIGRLRGDQIVAIAGSCTKIVGIKIESKVGLIRMFPALWQLYSESFSRHYSLWDSGDIHFFEDATNITSKSTYSYYDVRFRPSDIVAMLPSSVKATDTIDAAPLADEAKPSGKPVSSAHLQLWHELYLKVYANSPVVTLPHAIASAKGMFPDKSVGRDRVRELRAGGKTGPKKAMPDT